MKRVLVAAGALLALQAHASVHLLAVPDDSCGNWTALRADGPSPARIQLKNWVIGFISGWAWTNYKLDPVLGAIDNYCREHPLDALPDAAGVLTFDLKDRALHRPREPR